MKHKVTIGLQIVPKVPDLNSYAIVDKAIEVIQKSGLKYVVTPFETVMEGDYDEIMKVCKAAQDVCYEAGTIEMLTYIKIHSRAKSDATIQDKMEKYK